MTGKEWNLGTLICLKVTNTWGSESSRQSWARCQRTAVSKIKWKKGEKKGILDGFSSQIQQHKILPQRQAFQLPALSIFTHKPGWVKKPRGKKKEETKEETKTQTFLVGNQDIHENYTAQNRVLNLIEDLRHKQTPPTFGVLQSHDAGHYELKEGRGRIFFFFFYFSLSPYGFMRQARGNGRNEI